MSELKATRIKMVYNGEIYEDFGTVPCTQLYYRKDEADKVIEELKEERRWRKFPDEKPEEDTWCIVFHDGEIDSDHYMRFAYNNKCDFALYGNEVTHWMPLPSAPKD